jgi:hypothetical protein
MNEDYKTITENEVVEWAKGTIANYTLTRLTEILNGEYDLDEARRDILSFRAN